MEKEKWKWQEEGTSWRGIGIYHVTLTIPSRQPLLGSLVIPDVALNEMAEEIAMITNKR